MSALDDLGFNGFRIIVNPNVPKDQIWLMGSSSLEELSNKINLDIDKIINDRVAMICNIGQPQEKNIIINGVPAKLIQIVNNWELKYE